MLDLLVVGAGLSGLMAAYTAARAGLKVEIVNKGLGAMHWSAGTIDLLGYPSATASQAIKRPQEALQGFIKDSPTHPYALINNEQISEFLQSFLDLTAEIGLPYGGATSAGDNLFLPSPAGAERPTYFAPQAQMPGDLSRPEPILVVGFEQMRDFYPLLIAENLTKLGYQARAVFLPMDLLTERQDVNTVQLARGLDDQDRRSQLAKKLHDLVQPGERLALPAVLGLNAHGEVVSELEQTCGVPVFEIPTMPPSVPGIRLFSALQKKLSSMGVRIETSMEVISSQKMEAANGSAGQVQWVESKTMARPLKHRARNFLLATGGILGGGFNSDQDGRVWETILDLPLTIPQDRSEWFESSFLSPAGHPVYTGGVPVNTEFQPVSSAGQVLYDNLWAAGHMLAGGDPILEHSVEGIAILTGMAAGKAVAAR